MIKITNGKEYFNLKENNLIICDRGYIKKPVLDYYLIELLIVKEDNYLKEIVKTYIGGDTVLDTFKSKKLSNDTILLSEKDYVRLKKVYTNMISKNNLQKKAIIEAYAELLSFEYYQATEIEDCANVSKDEIFDDELSSIYDYKKYKKEIYKRSEEILKDKYYSK